MNLKKFVFWTAVFAVAFFISQLALAVIKRRWREMDKALARSRWQVICAEKEATQTKEDRAAELAWEARALIGFNMASVKAV
jgi:preprotein translocase subunit SecG